MERKINVDLALQNVQTAISEMGLHIMEIQRTITRNVERINRIEMDVKNELEILSQKVRKHKIDENAHKV